MADFDGSGSCEALLGQFRLTERFVATLTEQQAHLPTRLGNWRVIELVAHLTASLELVRHATNEPATRSPMTSPLTWYRNVDDFAALIDAEARAAASVGWTQVRQGMERHLQEVTLLLDRESPDLPVTAGNDTMTLQGLSTTRCVEAVLHTLDLGSALSSSAPLDPSAVEIVRRFIEVADNGDRLARPEL